MDTRQQSENAGERKVTHLKPALSKADIAFGKKFEALVKLRPLHATLIAGKGLSRARREPLDVAATEALFLEYGAYLNLIGEDGEYGRHRVDEMSITGRPVTYMQESIKSEES